MYITQPLRETSSSASHALVVGAPKRPRPSDGCFDERKGRCAVQSLHSANHGSDIPVVLHFINGLNSLEEITACVKALKDEPVSLSIVILGWKVCGRARNTPYKKTLSARGLLQLHSEFSIPIAFDESALKQLRLRTQLPKYIWEARFLGPDGSISRYVDLVQYKHGRNSVSNLKPGIMWEEE